MKKFCLPFLVYFCTLGCGGMTQFPTAVTTGKVTCDGAPVAKALVYFETMKQGGADASYLVGQGGFALTREDGTFSVATYGENDGAVVGHHKVRVGPSESTGKCKCSLDPMKVLLEVDIVAGKVNDFAILLTKATAKEAGAKGFNKADSGDE